MSGNNGRARTEQQPEIADSGDDDFEDFGGFEAAEPVPHMATSQAQPSDSPWAIFNAGSAHGRPDLLCAQNRFPTYLDPSDISGASAEGVDYQHINSIGNIVDQQPLDLFGENQLDQARIAENVLDGTLLAGAGPAFHQSLVNGRLPDIGLGINENRLFSQEEQQQQQPAIQPNEALLPPLLQDEGAAVGDLWPADEPRRLDTEHVPEPQENQVVEDAAALPEADASVAISRVTDKAFQELAAIEERNSSLEAELSRCQEQLAEQRQRLQEVHATQESQLDSLRTAGHDTLALVVEQYKEQSRAVVLEQQEVAQLNLLQTLREQMKIFQETLQSQKELYERQREEDKQELQHTLEKSLDEARQTQQEKFDKFLLEEQEKQKKAINKAVEEERINSQEQIRLAVIAEQEKTKAAIEEIKAEYSLKLEEEKKSHELALQAAREEQQKIAHEEIVRLVNEERERGRAGIREALELSRVETQAYINEQRQADSRVRRRHLASLDLFLESSRQQIELLLQCEKTELPISDKDKKKENTDET
ncbi:coiled-coil domain-containing protein 91-like isoform X2 [Physella acuta]|uniref:coiled-coil domain-containing protein 91-like isoform X2 n=1 Tax=Physella acuta TaxID=109671 RepID=UPI0027DD279B|nr:coiled-coil domain-containing protein 91-like isoform X2 [Physella acuta]